MWFFCLEALAWGIASFSLPRRESPTPAAAKQAAVRLPGSGGCRGLEQFEAFLEALLVGPGMEAEIGPARADG